MFHLPASPPDTRHSLPPAQLDPDSYTAALPCCLSTGFPVKFSIPVFPTITANIEFTRCEVGAAKQADWFEVPADFKMDAYVDRSWWKQM